MKICCAEGILLNLAFLKINNVINVLIVYICSCKFQKQMTALSMLDTAVGQGSSTQNHWRSQPKNLGVAKKLGAGKMLDFRRITLFCLEKRLSKHNMTILSKTLGGHDPYSTPWLRLCSKYLSNS